MTAKHDTPEPGLALLRRVQAAFVLQGTTLGRWCKRQGLLLSSVRHVLTGSSNGAPSRALRKRILAAAQVDRLREDAAPAQEAA